MHAALERKIPLNSCLRNPTWRITSQTPWVECSCTRSDRRRAPISSPGSPSRPRSGSEHSILGGTSAGFPAPGVLGGRGTNVTLCTAVVHLGIFRFYHVQCATMEDWPLVRRRSSSHRRKGGVYFRMGSAPVKPMRHIMAELWSFAGGVGRSLCFMSAVMQVMCCFKFCLLCETAKIQYIEENTKRLTKDSQIEQVCQQKPYVQCKT